MMQNRHSTFVKPDLAHVRIDRCIHTGQNGSFRIHDHLKTESLFRTHVTDISKYGALNSGRHSTVAQHRQCMMAPAPHHPMLPHIMSNTYILTVPLYYNKKQYYMYICMSVCSTIFLHVLVIVGVGWGLNRDYQYVTMSTKLKIWSKKTRLGHSRFCQKDICLASFNSRAKRFLL